MLHTHNAASMLNTFLDKYELTFEDIYSKHVEIERAIKMETLNLLKITGNLLHVCEQKINFSYSFHT
jgi:hypothetical protein